MRQCLAGAFLSHILLAGVCTMPVAAAASTVALHQAMTPSAHCDGCDAEEDAASIPSCGSGHCLTVLPTAFPAAPSIPLIATVPFPQDMPMWRTTEAQPQPVYRSQAPPIALTATVVLRC